MGCNYKYICLKTGLSFFQFKNVCKRLACYNYSLVNTHFLKDFERKYKIDLYSRTKFDSKGRRPQFQFTLFEDELEVAQRKKMILKRYHQVLKMEKKMIEDIREDLQGAILRQKEISRKHHVSEYFVLSCRTERKKRVVKNHVVVKTGDTTTKIPLHKKERVLKFLNSWFDGRVITLTIQEDLSKFDVLGLVQDGKIKEALKRIELT
jgi:hypothetical protein